MPGPEIEGSRVTAIDVERIDRIPMLIQEARNELAQLKVTPGAEAELACLARVLDNIIETMELMENTWL